MLEILEECVKLLDIDGRNTKAIVKEKLKEVIMAEEMKLKEALYKYRDDLVKELSKSVDDSKLFEVINNHLIMVNNLIDICAKRNKF